MKPEELFEKLIKNEISREEFETLLEGFDDDEIRAKYDEYLAALFEKEMSSHLEGLEEASKKTTIEDVLNVSNKVAIKKEGGRKLRKYPVAAIILIFIGTLFSVMLAISWLEQEEVDNLAYETEESSLITKSTPNRRMFRMRLEDGSFVHLNAVSKIIYPQTFGNKRREIEIEGEAYFDIARDETKPFNIKVKDHDVEVLGTSFNIKAYNEDDDFSVAVESGKVRVDLKIEGIEPVMLTKGQKLIFSSRSKKAQVVPVNTEEELIWRKGILKFQSTPMAQVEKMLERWYGVEVIIEDKDIYSYNFTGNHENKNITSVLEALSFMTGTEYRIKNDSIIIKN
jgi:ferric-dicitrate binding protein FerR (iron transport regulator)